MSQGEAYLKAGGQGTLWQTEGLPNRPLPSLDGRFYALEALQNYLSLLIFNKYRGPNQPTEKFSIPFENIFTEWPDSEEMVDLADKDFPRLVFLPGDPQDHDWIGNVPFEDPATADVYARGTTVYLWAEHVEDMQMIVWCRDIYERAALIAGLEVAFNPIEDASCLHLKLPKYFNYVCAFSMEDGGRQEEADAVRNRRYAKFTINLRVPKAMLVNKPDLQPSLETDGIGSFVDLSDEENVQPPPIVVTDSDP